MNERLIFFNKLQSIDANILSKDDSTFKSASLWQFNDEKNTSILTASIEYIISTKRFDAPLFQNWHIYLSMSSLSFVFVMKLFVNLFCFTFTLVRTAIFRLFCKMIYFIRFFFLYLFSMIIMYVSSTHKNLLQILELNNTQINIHISNWLWSRFLMVDSQTHQIIKCLVNVNFLFKCVILELKKKVLK